MSRSEKSFSAPWCGPLTVKPPVDDVLRFMGLPSYEEHQSINREELGALHAAIATILAWPAAVFDEVVRWLAPEAAKPNGHDPHPPRFQAVASNSTSRRAKSAAADQVQHKNRRAAAHRSYVRRPGLSISALAKATSANRATTRERLQQLADRGTVEKDAEGLSRLAGEAPGPTLPPAAAS